MNDNISDHFFKAKRSFVFTTNTKHLEQVNNIFEWQFLTSRKDIPEKMHPHILMQLRLWALCSTYYEITPLLEKATTLKEANKILTDKCNKIYKITS